jgi:MFS family permease
MRSAGVGVPCTDVPFKRDARLWILIATILGSSLAFIDGTVVNVALPAVQANFHATLVDVQWVVESYGLFLGALILVGGSLGDLFGRRLTFAIGVAIFAVASAGCGAASNIHLLIIARSIQGVGAALLVPGSLAIISSSFDEKSRGQAIGTWSGFTAITTAIGPVLGGWLVEHASWRWVFFINLPLAAAVIAISVWRIPESRSATAGRIDWLAALVATVGLGGLIFGFIESVNLGWRNPLVFGSLIVGFGSLVAFLFIEARVNSPMLPLALFESRSFSGANLLTLFLYSAISIFFFLFPLNLIQVQGDGGRCCGASLDFADVLSFPLVWRTCAALWSERTTDYWSGHCRSRFRIVRSAFRRRQLLEGFFPGDGGSGIRDGGYSGSAYHLCHEFCGSRSSRHGFGNQQCRSARSRRAGYCGSWNCDGEGLWLPPEPQSGTVFAPN